MKTAVEVLRNFAKAMHEAATALENESLTEEDARVFVVELQEPLRVMTQAFLRCLPAADRLQPPPPAS